MLYNTAQMILQGTVHLLTEAAEVCINADLSIEADLRKPFLTASVKITIVVISKRKQPLRSRSTRARNIQDLCLTKPKGLA